MNKFILALVLCEIVLINTAYSETEIHIMRGESSFWLCKAHDSENNQWLAKSPYQQVAINQAYDECKKKSQRPTSCEAAKELCDSYIKGVSIRPMWQCTALDQLAHVWESDI